MKKQVGGNESILFCVGRYIQKDNQQLVVVLVWYDWKKRGEVERARGTRGEVKSGDCACKWYNKCEFGNWQCVWRLI